MGMSINDAISWLNTEDYESKGFAEATSVAINTMRKYQKIEQIIHDDWIKGVNSGATLNKIEEVIEDEND